LLCSTALRQILLCARQTGKSTATAGLALYHALHVPKAVVLLLSPSLRQSTELFRKILWLMAALPHPLPVARQTGLFLELRNGNRIISLPSSEQTIRGFSEVTLLVIDEAARVPDELYFSVRPMLAVSGGKLICLSTPYGKRGWFHDAWVGEEAWERITVTASECPRISAAFLDEERRTLGSEWFAQEYLCRFADAGHQVFDRDQVLAAIDPNVLPLFPQSETFP
jgi:hypothetical protein